MEVSGVGIRLGTEDVGTELVGVLVMGVAELGILPGVRGGAVLTEGVAGVTAPLVSDMGVGNPGVLGVTSPLSGCGVLGLVATTMSSTLSRASGLRGFGVLAPLLASVLQLSSLLALPRPTP